MRRGREMEVNKYRKVEGMLYSHYKKKKRVDILKCKVVRIDIRISELRKDIKECNIDLEDTMKAIDYSSDPIQSNSSTTSNIERELEKATDRLLNFIASYIREKYKLKSRIMNLEKQIENIEVVLEKLTDEELQIVELRYGEMNNYREMEEKLHMGRSTLQRKKDRLINFLSTEIV